MRLAKIDTGLPGLPEVDPTADTSVQLRAVYDTRDSIGLPTRGSFLNARYVRSRDWLGGIRTFPGLRPGELRGNGYWFAGTSYSWRLVDLQPLFGQALYAGLRLQAGEMKERFDDVADDTLYGVSGSVGGRTPIGPFLLSLGYVDNGSWELQFMLGRPVAEGSLLDAIH